MKRIILSILLTPMLIIASVVGWLCLAYILMGIGELIKQIHWPEALTYIFLVVLLLTGIYLAWSKAYELLEGVE
jgi:drug/metabolite transporter (DMT)-like permease